MLARGRVLHGLDRTAELRFPREIPAVDALYQEYMGAPLSERAERLLRTGHEGRFMPPAANR